MPPKRNIDELNKKRTHEERVEAGRRAGKASAEARRKKADVKKTFSVALSTTLRKGVPGKIACLEEFRSGARPNLTATEIMAYTHVIRGMNGDVRSAEFALRASGQMPNNYIHVIDSYKTACAELEQLVCEFCEMVERHVTDPAQRLAIGKELEERRNDVLQKIKQLGDPA